MITKYDQARPLPVQLTNARTLLVAATAGLVSFVLSLCFWQAADHYMIISAAMLGFFALGQVGRLTCYLVTLGYRLAISFALIQISPAMMDVGIVTSIAAWLGLGLVSSLPVTLLKGESRGWRAVLVFLLYFVPPFGTISPCNPDLVIGLLYPNLGWVAVLLTAGTAWSVAEINTPAGRNAAIALLTISVGTNALWVLRDARAPDNWHAVNTRLGNFGLDITKRKEIANLQLPILVSQMAVETKTNVPSIWFLAEGMIHDKMAVTDMTWSVVLQKTNATAVVGEYFRGADDSMQSGVRVLGAESRDTGDLVRMLASTTAPGTMWHPWNSTDHFPLRFPNATTFIDNHWLHMSWCMESTIVWPHFSASLRNRPEVMVSIENRWMSEGTSLEHAHNVSAQLNARWLGASLLRAINY